jgi:hypothetical protein
VVSHLIPYVCIYERDWLANSIKCKVTREVFVYFDIKFVYSISETTFNHHHSRLFFTLVTRVGTKYFNFFRGKCNILRKFQISHLCVFNHFIESGKEMLSRKFSPENLAISNLLFFVHIGDNFSFLFNAQKKT